MEALAREDDQQSHRCQESAARVRRSGAPRRPREQRYRPRANEPSCRCRGSAQRNRFPTTRQRRIPCLVSNDQPTAVRTIASAVQLEHSLPAQSRQEHHARRPSRATAMRPGAIVRVRTRFDVQRRLSAQIPTAPLCARKVVSAVGLSADDATKLLRAPRSALCETEAAAGEMLVG